MLKITLAMFAIGLAVHSQELPEDPALKTQMIKLDAAHTKAILTADFAALDSLLHNNLTVNSPRGTINDKKGLFEAIRRGSVRYTSFERRPERFIFYKDMVVIMGNETVVPAATAPMAGQTVNRRYTDIWMKQNGKWQLHIRHANIVCDSK